MYSIIFKLPDYNVQSNVIYPNIESVESGLNEMGFFKCKGVYTDNESYADIIRV